MTVIVAAADETRTVVGAERLLASGTGHPGIPPECYHLAESKIWRLEPDLILGACGSWQLAQLLAAELPVDPGDDLRRWLVGDVADLVLEIKTRETIAEKSMLLVARGPEICCLSARDLSVYVAKGHGPYSYCAIGAGRHWAYGSLRTSAVLRASLEEAVRLALEAAAEHSPMVGGPPFDFLVTEANSGR